MAGIRRLAFAFALAASGTALVQAQGGARAAAPRDFTGYWVSVVTEHWHLRMLMPPKGDYSMLPLTPEGRKAADAWDPARDKADGNECRSYGAANIMRVPGRLHIHWADDNTLQVDADSGTQTRLFHFAPPQGRGAPPAGTPPQWQGSSAAAWEGLGGRGGRGGRATGQMRVVTTNLRPGYLRKNGVPYSENARLEEYFETFSEPNGDRWLEVTSIVTDPRYLTQPYATTYPFRKIPDGQGWDPTPCRADEAR
ncbi:MAG: hypothetical protein HY824_09925 [Acidobacteria bacterium]|nr:hypothetical protein [Acidobacteriota bacterium]